MIQDLGDTNKQIKAMFDNQVNEMIQNMRDEKVGATLFLPLLHFKSPLFSFLFLLLPAARPSHGIDLSLPPSILEKGY